MKLYVLKILSGRYVKSPRKPISRLVHDYRSEIEAGLPGMDWIEWGKMQFLPWFWQVAIFNWYMHLAIDVYGWERWPMVVKAFVNTKLFQYGEKMFLWKVVALTMPTVIMLAAVYIENPEVRDIFITDVFPWRYLMRYHEYVWAVDLLKVDEDGTPHYSVCHDIGPVIQFEDWNRMYYAEKGDLWSCSNLWVESRYKFMMYERWYYDLVLVDFIGYLSHTGPNLYTLHSGYTDPYVAEVIPPWRAGPDLLCKVWREREPGL